MHTRADYKLNFRFFLDAHTSTHTHTQTYIVRITCTCIYNISYDRTFTGRISISQTLLCRHSAERKEVYCLKKIIWWRSLHKVIQNTTHPADIISKGNLRRKKNCLGWRYNQTRIAFCILYLAWASGIFTWHLKGKYRLVHVFLQPSCDHIIQKAVNRKLSH